MPPLPPDNDVPPGTTAAMAFNSNDSPVAGCAANHCEAIINPVIAAQKPEII
jgi:hypothetical protein